MLVNYTKKTPYNIRYYKQTMTEKILGVLPRLLTNHFSQKILDKHCISAIGYGSGVFPQTSSKNNNINNTIDVMLVVNNANKFHEELYQYQPNDYAGLVRVFGSSYLEILNRFVFPVHFNHVTMEDYKVKYAVIDVHQLIEDLNNWNLLTLAGRLHKPVLSNILIKPQPQNLLKSLACNHKMALNISILKGIGKIKQKQPIKFQQLYHIISNISYAGDIRHTMAIENVNKVSNIVTNNLAEFDKIYLPLMQDLAYGLIDGTVVVEPGKRTIAIKYTPQLINQIVEKGSIPKKIYESFQQMQTGGKEYKSLTEKLLMNGVSLIPKQIQEKLAKINKISSMRMAAENFLGASPLNNLKYILAKINKKQIK